VLDRAPVLGFDGAYNTMFQNSIIAVTGASSGLGRALAIELGAQGAELLLFGRSEERLEETRARIVGAHSVTCIACDLGSAESIASAGAAMQKAFPRMDALVHCAAGWLDGPMESADPQAVQDLIHPIVSGTFLMIQGLLPLLKKSDRAHIVNILSTAGSLYYPISSGMAAYHAAKWGQAGLTEALREEFKSDNIRITGLYPGYFTEAGGCGALAQASVVDGIIYALRQPSTVSVDNLAITAVESKSS